MRFRALPDENNDPDDFAGIGDAGVSPFYKSLSKRLGGELTSPGAKAIKVKNLIKGRFARFKMKHMFKLTESQFDHVLVEAKADVCWRPMIEELGGGKFEKPDCPSSAALVTFAARTASDMPAVGRGDVKVVKENTLSDELGRESVDRVWVPKSLLRSFHVMDTLNTEVGTTEAGILSLDWALWAFGKSGKLNFGIYFIRHCAKQFEQVYPKGYAKPGILRWEKILGYKAECMARRDAAVRHTCLAPALTIPASTHTTSLDGPTLTPLLAAAVVHPHQDTGSDGGLVHEGAREDAKLRVHGPAP